MRRVVLCTGLVVSIGLVVLAALVGGRGSAGAGALPLPLPLPTV